MTATRERSTEDAAASLRAEMVAELRGPDGIVSEAVASAIGVVPRHLFAPDVQLEEAYDPYTAPMVKRGEDGLALSVMSATHIQAVMLEQADVAAGMRVLEIGSGGYNAALIAELVGETGVVTTVDIDADITSRARACLDSTGYERVNVVLADAEHGVPGGAPYDRIIVTAGAFDIAPAWLGQLTGGGRIVVPLRLRGLTRSIAFDRNLDGILVSSSYRLCGFVPMQGDGAHHELIVPIEDGLFLHVDDRSQRFDPVPLRDAAGAEPLAVWSGLPFDLPDELELFLLTNASQIAQLHASAELVAAGRFDASAGRGVPALIGDGGFAYRIKRANSQVPGGFEIGVVAHGPNAERVAEEYCDLLRLWVHGFARRGAARIRYIPDAVSAAGVVQEDVIAVKPHGAVTVSWE
ncbi:methyltransferase, FxLD system [Spirillospora sp. CA-128828]|uniref:methyltransferase, FxLD system n=1 Tax=Spirillospora sp. CA-128828 TaxID=3240033 RepID=UPI003D8DAD97